MILLSSTSWTNIPCTWIVICWSPYEVLYSCIRSGTVLPDTYGYVFLVIQYLVALVASYQSSSTKLFTLVFPYVVCKTELYNWILFSQWEKDLGCVIKCHPISFLHFQVLVWKHKINRCYIHGKKACFFLLKISVRLGMDNIPSVKLHCIAFFIYLHLGFFFLLNFLWKSPDFKLLGKLLCILLSNFDIYSSIIKYIYIYACAKII